jgi:excisionase family DNA binding protein
MLTGEGVGAAWPLLVTTGDNGVITANCVLVETGIGEGNDMTEDFEKGGLRYRPPQVMTIEEVAVYLSFAEATIRRMLRDREIPAAKVAGQWRFLKTEVDRWLADLSKQLVAPQEAKVGAPADRNGE